MPGVWEAFAEAICTEVSKISKPLEIPPGQSLPYWFME
jgi:hypothetical protein